MTRPAKFRVVEHAGHDATVLLHTRLGRVRGKWSLVRRSVHPLRASPRDHRSDLSGKAGLHV
jgi:hypothetical protein